MTTRPTLAEPIIVDQWWQTRGGKAIGIRLSSWQGKNLFDLRSWHSEQGRLKPSKKGPADEVRHGADQ